MVVSREVHERWSRMLQDPDPAAQMRALTEIGRSYFRPAEVGSREERDIRGAIPVKGPAKPGLPNSLRDAILEKLQAEDPHLRAEAVLALVHWHDDRTVDAIKNALDDPAVSVRLAAIQAAAMIKQGELIGELIGIAESDQEEIVRAKAVDAIQWIQKEAEKEPTGAIRTRSPAQRSLSQVLDEIRITDSSAYVRFLAGRPASPR